MSKFSNFINSPVVLLILGFILTTIIGTCLSDRIQRQSRKRDIEIEAKREKQIWKRERKFEILKRNLDDREKLIEDISNLFNVRLYKMHNLYRNLSYKSIKEINQEFVSYSEAVNEWNLKLPNIRSKIKRLISNDLAETFRTYPDDYISPEDPPDVNGLFDLAHRHLIKLLQCKTAGNTKEFSVLDNMVKFDLGVLDFETSSFLEQISSVNIEQSLQFEINVDSILQRY